MKPNLLYPTLIAVALALSCSGGGGSQAPTSPGGGGGTNHAPTVNLNIDKAVVSPTETATLTASTADADGDQVTLSWSAGRGSVQSSGPTATTATYTAPSTSGVDSAVVVVSDGNGGTGRAAADTYVRKTGTPAFVLGATTSTSCGPGTANPDGFLLTITSPENVLITTIAMQPSSCAGTYCRTIKDYTPYVEIGAEQTYSWDLGGCQSWYCCHNSSSCGNCIAWTIDIWGHRPPPDSGSFFYECKEWSGPGDPSCNY